MAKVHVVTPVLGSMYPTHAQFREWLIHNEHRHSLLMYLMEGRPTADTRCKIAKRFLADADADYLMMLDADQWPADGDNGEPFFNPLDVIEWDADVVSFPYPTVRYSHPKGPVFWIPQEPMPRGYRASVQAIATGCVVIARRVLEHPEMRAPFVDVYDADGILLYGEDTGFSEKAIAAGFELFTAMDRPLHHAKAVDLLTLWRAWHMDSRPSQVEESRSFPKVGGGQSSPTGEVL